MHPKLGTVRDVYDFPPERPAMKPFYWSLDGGGRELIIERAKKGNVEMLVEVGVFLGGSTIQWLEALPSVTVIGVDPYNHECAQYFATTKEFYRATMDLKGMSDDEFYNQMNRPDAQHLAALSNLWEFKDRFVPVQGYAPAALYELHRLGLQADMFFLDAAKTGEELEVFRELWPSAIITGDDWNYQTHPETGIFDIRESVIPFAEKYGMEVIATGASWVLEPSAA